MFSDAGKNYQLSRNRKVLLLDPEGTLKTEISGQLAFFGYEVYSFRYYDELARSAQEQEPTAVLVALTSPQDSEMRFAEIAFFKNAKRDGASGSDKSRVDIPVLVLSGAGDIRTRLLAVRAGATGFFALPVDIGRLVDALDRFSSTEPPQPFNILLVEDSMTQASLFAMQLKRAGMETRIVSDPLQIVSHLQEFSPDLILMDLYMPGCTGIELVRVLRQIENFGSIPIVFLSAEIDRDRQIEALEQGGDDFLTKPIKPAHLVSAVTTRVLRYRRLRSSMRFDSLTGLLNHTMTNELLARELLRAKRENSTLSLAMLDLDGLKLVNEQFGTAAGDRVLKSIARLLQQRLRRTDIIGRIGGDEYVVIMPNTPLDAASSVVDNLRRAFGEIMHHAGDASFVVTFSCGLAASPPHTTLSDFSTAADRALQEAKRKGRNRIVVDGA